MQEIIDLLTEVEKKLELIDALAWKEDIEAIVELNNEVNLLIKAIKHKVGLKI